MSNKVKIYRKYDAGKEEIYSQKEYKKEQAEKLFDNIKNQIKEAKGFIIGESDTGFYARTCKFSIPFTMYYQ